MAAACQEIEAVVMDSDKPVPKLVNMILFGAAKKQVRHISIVLEASSRVLHWLDGAWHEELEMPVALHPMVIRRLAVLIGLLVPAVGQLATGKIHLVTESTQVRALVLIEHRDVLRALIELVTEDEFATRSAPELPAKDPYRHGA